MHCPYTKWLQRSFIRIYAIFLHCSLPPSPQVIQRELYKNLGSAIIAIFITVLLFLARYLTVSIIYMLNIKHCVLYTMH